MYRLMQPSDWAEVLALWQAQRGDTEEFVRGAVERFAGVQNVYVAEENDHIEAVALAVPVTCRPPGQLSVRFVRAGQPAPCGPGGYPVRPAETAGRRLCGGSARQPRTINAAAG